MSAFRAVDDLTLARALEIVRDATKDRSAFLLLPLGREADAYLVPISERRLGYGHTRATIGIEHRYSTYRENG